MKGQAYMGSELGVLGQTQGVCEPPATVCVCMCVAYIEFSESPLFASGSQSRSAAFDPTPTPTPQTHKKFKNHFQRKIDKIGQWNGDYMLPELLVVLVPVLVSESSGLED